MEQSYIETPKTAVLMVSPRDYRLSSLNGYVVTFRKNVPISVPPLVFQEAVLVGAQIVEGEEDKEAPEPTPTIDPSIAEAAELEAAAKVEALKNALTLIITRNDPEDFKADNTPKLQKVVVLQAHDFPEANSF